MKLFDELKDCNKCNFSNNCTVIVGNTCYAKVDQCQSKLEERISKIEKIKETIKQESKDNNYKTIDINFMYEIIDCIIELLEGK